MYSNGTGLGAGKGDNWKGKRWRTKQDEDRNFKIGKHFVRCICPKCATNHNVYMLWTGRGVPRKYCGNCRPLISGYDDVALYEAAVYAPGQSKKKGRRHEGDG